MEVSTIAVIRFKGAMNVNEFTAQAQKLHDSGTQNLLLHMSELTFMPSAGMRALLKIARLFSEKKQTSNEESQTDEKSGSGNQFHKHIKLFNPRENIQGVLDIVGFIGYFEIFTDLDVAIASFQ